MRKHQPCVGGRLTLIGVPQAMPLSMLAVSTVILLFVVVGVPLLLWRV